MTYPEIKERYTRRDSILRESNIKVLRINNEELQDAKVLAKIKSVYFKKLKKFRDSLLLLTTFICYYDYKLII